MARQSDKHFDTLDKIIEQAKELGFKNFVERLEETKKCGYELLARPNFKPMYSRLERLTDSERETFYFIAEVFPESCYDNFPHEKVIRAELQRRREKDKSENNQALSEQVKK